MSDEQKIEQLKEMLAEMENAFYGGFRFSANEEDIVAVKWAIENLAELVTAKEGE